MMLAETMQSWYFSSSLFAVDKKWKIVVCRWKLRQLAHPLPLQMFALQAVPNEIAQKVNVTRMKL